MVLKGVSLMLVALGWVVMLPVILWHVLKRIKTRRNIRREIETELKSGKQYYMHFDEEGLVYGADDFKTELAWTYFVARLETSSILLLFYKEGTYSFQTFTSTEIGNDNLEQLKDIVREKLPLLNEKIKLKDCSKKQ